MLDSFAATGLIHKALSGCLRSVSNLPQEKSSPQFAVVTLAFEGGGPERDTVFLCNALAAMGADVALVVLRGEGPLRSFVDTSVRITAIGERRIRYAVPALHRTLRRLAPRLVLSSGVPSLNLLTLIAVLTMPRRTRPKLIIREGAVPSMARFDPSRSNRIAYRALRLLYRYADRVITLTEGARRDLSRKFSVPETMISVMRTNAVLPSPIVNGLAAWDGETGREDDLIVCAGRLSAEKDHQTLFRALAILPAGRRWRLAIIGDGPERQALEAFARAAGLADRVVFTGYVTSPLQWMMRARLVVLSSIYEGLGNVIIEALACGTPVVCTDCPYGPREILQGGRYGTLTPVGDPAALADAIAAALDHTPDRRPLVHRGLEYTAERAASQFLQIVADLQPNSGGPNMGWRF